MKNIVSIGEQIKTRHYDHSAVVFGKGELLDEILRSPSVVIGGLDL